MTLVYNCKLRVIRIIAQLYWKARDWEKTREWLNIIIEKAGNGDSFYRDLAQRRLLKVEY